MRWTQDNSLQVKAAMGVNKKAEYAVTILKPREDVYREWRNWENLPNYSRHLKKVEDLGDSKTRWTVEGPTGELTWEAQTTVDVPNETIGWRSLSGADVDNIGRIDFTDAPGDRGTEVVARIVYNPPGGIFGDLLGKATGTSAEAELAETLRRFKAILECGEVPIIEGQPSNQMRKENMPGDSSPKVGLR